MSPISCGRSICGEGGSRATCISMPWRVTGPCSATRRHHITGVSPYPAAPIFHRPSGWGRLSHALSGRRIVDCMMDIAKAMLCDVGSENSGASRSRASSGGL